MSNFSEIKRFPVYRLRIYRCEPNYSLLVNFFIEMSYYLYLYCSYFGKW